MTFIVRHRKTCKGEEEGNKSNLEREGKFIFFFEVLSLKKKKKSIQDPFTNEGGIEFATPHISLKIYFMKSCLENYRRDLFGYHRMGLRSDLFKGIN